MAHKTFLNQTFCIWFGGDNASAKKHECHIQLPY